MKSFTSAAMLLGVFFLFSFTVNPKEDEPNSNSDAKNIVHYRIELCSFKNSVPVKTAETLRTIGGVMPVKTYGRSVYYTAPYGSEEEAQNDIEKFQEMGFEKAHQVVQYNDQFISLEEYHRIEKTGPGVRIWK